MSAPAARLASALAVALLTASGTAAAQRTKVPRRAARPAAAAALNQSPSKGIWESVGFPEDLALRDVFFVTPEAGWAAGAAGTILHTTDAGATWTPQLGGDPHSQEKEIGDLRFIDQVHGWAVENSGFQSAQRLLRTIDGQSWEPIGVLDHSFQYNYADYRFTTPNDGVYLVSGFIYQTHDAGRHWRQVFECNTKAEIEGLTKEVGCTFYAVSFPTLQIGYAIGASRDIEDRFFLAKTEDGGTTWSLTLPAGPDMVDGFGSADAKLIFTDPNSGIMTVQNGRKIYTTQDGGQTWRGLIGIGGNRLAFADPEVGWSLDQSTLSYTTDGGAHWLSRELRFPASVNGFSLPRRDRAYVVGDHGMVYRYRVVPSETVIGARAIAAPAMPGMPTALATDVGQLQTQVAAIDSGLTAFVDPGTATGSAAPPSAGGFTQDGVSPFVNSCCAKRLSALQLVLSAVTGIVPEFTGKYRNLNLLTQGLRTAAALPDALANIKAAWQGFRTSGDQAAALSALAQVKSLLATLRAATDTALQQPTFIQ